MKGIGITLLLLAMVFAGCEKIKNQVDVVQSGVKSNISKILDSKSDSDDSDTALLEQTIVDTSFIGMHNFPMLNNPYSTENQYPLYNPFKFDTTLGNGNLQPQYN